MITAKWARAFQEYEVADAAHEAGHAVAAKLLGAVNVWIRLTPNNWNNRGFTNLDLAPDESAPDQGYRVGPSPIPVALRPLSDGLDVATRLWVVTRAGGVGGLICSRNLGFQLSVEQVMADCAHDDEALEAIVSTLDPADAERWVALRYRETWAVLMGCEDRLVAVARAALLRDDSAVQVELDRIREVTTSRPDLVTEPHMARADAMMSEIGFEKWPNWREHTDARVRAYESHLRQRPTESTPEEG